MRQLTRNTLVSAGERLGSTLFVAALVHGVVILGVTFTAASFESTADLPSLNVTLVATGRDDEPEPDKPDFIANTSQRGAGSAGAGIRPTTTLAADHPLSQLGDPTGADLTDGTPRAPTPSAEQLVTRSSAAERQPLPDPTDQPADRPERAAALIANVAPQTRALEIDLAAELTQAYEESGVAAPATQESKLAGYLDGWRRRVERIGTANFPAQLLGNGAVGRPTLEVAIGAEGQLVDIVVRRSSGDQALDQVALKILRLAAPFEPLPDHIRAEYDVLKFAYEWDFATGRTPRP